MLFILFCGHTMPKSFWQYRLGDHKKVNFLTELKKLGHVYYFTTKINNALEYYKKDEENKKFYDKVDNITLDDLDIDKECKRVYDIVKDYKGKFIPIAHSIGGLYLYRFIKLYKERCYKAILIDSGAYVYEIANSKFHSKYFENQKDTTNEYLQELFNKIKNNKENQKYIDELDKIVFHYYHKFIDKEVKLLIPYFSFIDLRIDSEKVDENSYLRNYYKVKNNEILKIKTFYFVNQGHMPWFNPENVPIMIEQIKQFIK